MTASLLLATQNEVVSLDSRGQTGPPARGLEGLPTGVAADPWRSGRAWCCTREGGVFRTDDSGASWYPSGLEGQRLMSVVASPARVGQLWAGGEPSAVWRSDDAGATWRACTALGGLPSSPEWAFPPRPETHHVRWIACDPTSAERLWVAIEAGALVRTEDGGATWIDRVPGGPYDTHELAIHPRAPRVLHSAAGDGYFESRDGGSTWSSPMEGLDVGYLRSVAIDPGDPERVVVSAASRPRSAYVAGRSDGRLYRREGSGRWERIVDGWPNPPNTIAPLVIPGAVAGEFFAGDERGVHRSGDGGASWAKVWAFDRSPDHLRGIALLR